MKRRMHNKLYTDEEEDFIRKHHETMTYKEIGEKLGRTHNSVSARARKLGLRKQDKEKHIDWVGSGMLDRLRELYPRTKNAVIAEILGVSKQQVVSTALYYGIKKAKDYVHEGRYRTGIPSANTLPIGTVRMHGSRVLIKVTDNKENPKHDWVSYQYYLWVGAGNRQPKDNEVLRIKPQYVGLHHSKWTVEHIECVTMAEHLERNSINRYPKELNSAIRILARINREIENEHQ